ncbi:MAG: hypothetical protein ACKV1O_01140 [Saprospiraceae bacterium]
MTPENILPLLGRIRKYRSGERKTSRDGLQIRASKAGFWNTLCEREYHKAVTKETFADKLPTKTTRFMIFEGIGVALDLGGASGIGTVITTGLAVFDSFYLDKLISGWKPNQFIKKDLKPKIKK